VRAQLVHQIRKSNLEVVADLVVIDDDERNKKSIRPWVHDVNTKREELGETCFCPIFNFLILTKFGKYYKSERNGYKN